MDLPEIPDAVIGVAGVAADQARGRMEWPIPAALVAAWPRLYAAALRHAATEVLEDDDACSDLLRRAADSVSP